MCQKPKLRALQQQDISILKSAREKTQPAAEDGYTGNTYCTDCKKTISYGQTIKKPVTILGMTEKSQKSLLVQQTA